MGNTPIKLELLLDEVNGVLTALGQLPYVQTAALIEKIRDQATPQVPVNVPRAEEVVPVESSDTVQ